MSVRKLAVSSAVLAVAFTGAWSVPAAVSATPAPSATIERSSSEHVLQIDYQVQETSYWCGPAAARIALSARGIQLSQADLAAQIGTHEGGTDWIGQVTGALNTHVGWYETKEMPNDPPTQEQKDLLWSDIVRDIDNGYAVVTNIVAPPGNQPPGYPPDQTIYHYFTVIGYDDAAGTVLIADPASFSGNQIYWLSFEQLSTLIPPKGYSA